MIVSYSVQIAKSKREGVAYAASVVEVAVALWRCVALSFHQFYSRHPSANSLTCRLVQLLVQISSLIRRKLPPDNLTHGKIALNSISCALYAGWWLLRSKTCKLRKVLQLLRILNRRLNFATLKLFTRRQKSHLVSKGVSCGWIPSPRLFTRQLCASTVE